MSFVFAQYNNEWKTLKVGNIRVNKKEFHKPKQPIHLELVNLDQIVISDKFKHNDDSLSILLVTKKVKLLNRWLLFCIKWVDTKNTLKTVAKACLL